MSLARWQDLCLDATDPERLGAFWAPVLGLRRDPEVPQAVTLVGTKPSQRVWVNLVDRPKRVKNRLHLDVYAESIDELVRVGATVVAAAEDTGFSWTVMADPEGGEFCAFLRAPDELPAYRLHGVVIDAADPRALAAWWGNVFGVAPVVDEDHDWHTLEHATPDPVLTLDFVPVPEPRVGPNRVHWDVTGDVDALLAAGATHLWDMPNWTVLADPEGNEFCVFPAKD
jgi:hypothetical protein